MTQPTETSVHLWSTKAGADKVYNLFLRPKADGWTVDFTNGKRGSTMQTGTRTGKPVLYEAALKLFKEIVSAKTKDGYGPIETGTAYTSNEFSGRATGLDVQLLTSIDEQRCNELITDDDWVFQLKEDGERRPIFVKDGIVTGGNRNGLLVDIPAQWVKDFAVFENAIFDGEHVGDHYAVFDLLSLNGEDLRSYPFASRYLRMIKLLDTEVEQPASMRQVEVHASYIAKNWLLKQVREQQLEGVVIKRGMAPYAAGRSGDALKFKLTESATCIVVRQNTQRSIVLGLLDANGVLVEQGNVTVPVNYGMPEPDELVEVRYTYYTGKAFNQPVYGGKRTDQVRADANISQITRFKPGVLTEMACA